MRHYFEFAGVNSKNYGIKVLSVNNNDAPERDTTVIEVPGRNGDLTIDNGRYKNKPIIYNVAIDKDYETTIANLRDWLSSVRGYQRLEDDYHPDEFRLARFTGGITISSEIARKAGVFQLKFDCKPQRYLKSGEEVITATGRKLLRNPTNQIALPLLRVYGTSGTVSLASTSITFNVIDGYVDVDCEMQNAYKGTTNCNGNLTMKTGDFYAIQPGNYYLSFTSGITQVDITPRWYRI